MAEQKLHVTLIAHTPEPEKVIAMASRTCYSPLDLAGLKDKAETADNAAYIRRVLASGHTSVIEHASFTFGIEGVSRTLLAQITRHRMASFSVQSQRYVSNAGQEVFDFVMPPRIRALGPEAEEKFLSQMKTMQGWYDEWSELLGEGSAEDARFVCADPGFGCAQLCAARRGCHAHDHDHERARAAALFLAADVQPCAVGNSRAGLADVCAGLSARAVGV